MHTDSVQRKFLDSSSDEEDLKILIEYEKKISPQLVSVDNAESDASPLTNEDHKGFEIKSSSFSQSIEEPQIDDKEFQALVQNVSKETIRNHPHLGHTQKVPKLIWNFELEFKHLDGRESNECERRYCLIMQSNATPDVLSLNRLIIKDLGSKYYMFKKLPDPHIYIIDLEFYIEEVHKNNLQQTNFENTDFYQLPDLDSFLKRDDTSEFSEHILKAFISKINIVLTEDVIFREKCDKVDEIISHLPLKSEIKRKSPIAQQIVNSCSYFCYDYFKGNLNNNNLDENDDAESSIETYKNSSFETKMSRLYCFDDEENENINDSFKDIEVTNDDGEILIEQLDDERIKELSKLLKILKYAINRNVKKGLINHANMSITNEIKILRLFKEKGELYEENKDVLYKSLFSVIRARTEAAILYFAHKLVDDKKPYERQIEIIYNKYKSEIKDFVKGNFVNLVRNEYKNYIGGFGPLC